MRKTNIISTIILFYICIVLIIIGSIKDKPYSEMTLEEQHKVYEKFQADSLKNCTGNKRLAKIFAINAFNKLPGNEGHFKRDEIKCEYDKELKCWICKIKYHVDYDDNHRYESSVKLFVHLWQYFDDSKPSHVFYSVRNHNDKEIKH